MLKTHSILYKTATFISVLVLMRASFISGQLENNTSEK
ncbi:hypothetical protein VCHE16_3054 [Vibrio paracholerae HE-16]|nr:hypothetical protein VCHE16_3054 [Vibrio paracholerae HE-16]